MSDITTSPIATKRDLGIIAWALFVLSSDNPGTADNLLGLIWLALCLAFDLAALVYIAWFLVRWVLLDGWVKR